MLKIAHKSPPDMVFEPYLQENTNILMRKRTETNSQGTFFTEEALIAEYRTIKKTIQEYVWEIMKHNRYQSTVNYTKDGTILDDRSGLIDLYDSIATQDAHLAAVRETLDSQLTDERYMLARPDGKGGWIRDDDESKKIQGSQFEKIIRGIVDSRAYGYTLIEVMGDLMEVNGTKMLKEVNIIERRNVLPNQSRVVQRQGIWAPGWDLESEKYKRNYILINTGGLGYFANLVPIVLAKKFTLSNYIGFAHTYGQPIIHGKTPNDNDQDKKKLASDIAKSAEKRVVVTGMDDTIDVKTFTVSNSERVFTGLINLTNQEVSNLVLGSESMAGETQAYAGSAKTHEDIYRSRIKKNRKYVENVMNEQVIPVLQAMGFISDGVYFKYSNQIEISTENKVKLFDMLTEKYEVDAETIDKEFGVRVGKQINLALGGGSVDGDWGDNDHHIMTDEEYVKRYGHPRGTNARINFLEEK